MMTITRKIPLQEVPTAEDREEEATQGEPKPKPQPLAPAENGQFCTVQVQLPIEMYPEKFALRIFF